MQLKPQAAASSQHLPPLQGWRTPRQQSMLYSSLASQGLRLLPESVFGSRKSPRGNEVMGTSTSDMQSFHQPAHALTLPLIPPLLDFAACLLS